MTQLRKRQLPGVVASAFLLFGAPVLAQPAAEAERLDALFAELAEPGRTDWTRIEAEIARIWSQSGSSAMDLLLERGNEALEAKNFQAAVDHYSAVIDHAPDFAEAWNARATTFYLMDEYALSIADIGQVLALNPRHFGALSGLASMLEALDKAELALSAWREVRALNPNRPDIDDAIARLEKRTGETDL